MKLILIFVTAASLRAADLHHINYQYYNSDWEIHEVSSGLVQKLNLLLSVVVSLLNADYKSYCILELGGFKFKIGEEQQFLICTYCQH